MLDSTQVASIEAAMEEEHRRDREALARLKRFLPKPNGSPNGQSSRREPLQLTGETPLVPKVWQGVSEEDEADTVTIIGKVQMIFQTDANRKWTVPKMVEFLGDSGFQFAAARPERTMGLVFRKLAKRGVIRLQKKGSGRIPNVYVCVKEEPK